MRPRRASGLIPVAVLGLMLVPLSRASATAPEVDLMNELKSIAAVRLQGRHHVPAREIWTALKTRRLSRWPWRARPTLRLDFLRADTAAIVSLYRHYGYLDTRAEYRVSSTHDPRRAIVTFVIREGPRSRIATVELPGVRSYPPEQLRRHLRARPGRPFDPSYLQLDTTRISLEYQERGYLPHTQASARRDSLRVAVRYAVVEGPAYRVGQVYLSSPGELRVKERYVRRELLLRPGEIYRRSRVERSVERLYETGLFSQIQITPLRDTTRSLMEFDLRVRSRKPRWFDAGVGSGTAERFRFTGEWGHRNLAGQALQGDLASRLAFDGNGKFLLSRAEGSLLEPWLLRTRTRGQVTTYYEKRADRTDPRFMVEQEAKGLSFAILRPFTRYGQISLQQDNSFVTQKFSVLAPALSPAIRDSIAGSVVPSYTTNRLVLSAVREMRDNLLNATRGSTQSVAAEIAGGPLKGTSSFSKGQVYGAWYTPLRGDWVLVLATRAGTIAPFGDTARFSPEVGVDRQVSRVPLEARFRIGGVNSVRGYNENSIPFSGGLAMLQANAELRVPLVWSAGLEFFVDAGNVWARPSYVKARQFQPRRTRDRLDPGDVRYVFGVGARVDLKVALLRIDFAWSPRPDENGRWLVAAPQFAIGPSF